MPIPDWDRIEPVLSRLLELESSERDGFLSSALQGEPELAQRVRALLEAELAPSPFLTLPRAEGPADRSGEAVGNYRLIRPLGRGGMGEVWLAERADGEFEQQVALKLLHAGLDTRELLRRFRTERQILAWLEHPGIARLLDGGVGEDGRPYLVMEYVDGEALVHHAVTNELPTRARVELFLAVCGAVQHAHGRGVVHRDLKPGNVLVSRSGQPKLLDFGIAKVLGAGDEASELELTRTGHRLFSPLYASPEQVRGESVSPASDVYSLGVLLCELLTGRRPYDTHAASQLELERAVCETRARRPSDLAPSSVRPALQRELDWIVGMCLRKEPERRYASVKALADDLSSHLRNEPVVAGPDSLAYRAQSFTRRNRGLVLGTSVVILTLMLALAASLAAWHQAASSDRRSRASAYSSALHAAEAAVRESNVAAAQAQLASAPLALRGWEYRHLVSRLDRSRLRIGGVLARHDCLAPHPDGDRFAVIRPMPGETRVTLIDASSGVTLAERELSTAPRVEEKTGFVPWKSLAFHPSESLLAVAHADGILRLLDTHSLEVQAEVDVTTNHMYSLAYDPTGDFLACGLRTGEVAVLWHPGYGEVARFKAHDPGDLDLAFSSDGATLASCSWDERIRLWSVPGFQMTAELVGHEQHVTDVGFAPAGEAVVSSSIDGTARVWRLSAPEHPLIVRPHRGAIESLALHPDGETVFTGGADGAIQRWHLSTGEVVATLRGHGYAVLSLAVLGGNSLISAGSEGCRLWDLDAEDVPTRMGCEYHGPLAIHPDGRELSCAAPDGRLRRWSLPDLRSATPLAPRASSGRERSRVKPEAVRKAVVPPNRPRNSTAAG